MIIAIAIIGALAVVCGLLTIFSDGVGIMELAPILWLFFTIALFVLALVK